MGETLDKILTLLPVPGFGEVSAYRTFKNYFSKRYGDTWIYEEVRNEAIIATMVRSI